MQKSPLTIAVVYIILATLSTLINIGTQILSIWAYKGLYSIEISILTGTATGLPLRYVLEKRYIFFFKSESLSHDGRLFALYSFMSIFTTAIFWFTEYAFHLIFVAESMRYLGGVIGLGIGFYLKYRLDKKFVFVTDNQRDVS
jgi:putative flippase GtrA